MSTSRPAPPGPPSLPGHRPVEPVSQDSPALHGPVLMSQRWVDAAFVHWAVDPATLAGRLPAGVRPDTTGTGPFDGATWVGLVAFRMVGAGVGRGPGVPWAGTFLETNVRCYTVDDTGRRGIWFASLDADRALVVAGARAAFGLPYRWARMGFEDRAAPGSVPGAGRRELTYRLDLPAQDPPRGGGRGGLPGAVRGAVTGAVGAAVGGRADLRRLPLTPGARAAVSDLPLHSELRLRVDEAVPADPLTDFLTCRWGLHEQHLGQHWYVPNEHEPWPLRRAELVALDDDLVAAAGWPELRGRTPDHVGYSPGVRTRFGLPTDSRRPRRGSGDGDGDGDGA